MRSVRVLLRSNFCIGLLCSVKVPACFLAFPVSKLCGKGKERSSGEQARTSTSVLELAAFREQASDPVHLDVIKNSFAKTGLAKQDTILNRTARVYTITIRRSEERVVY